MYIKKYPKKVTPPVNYAGCAFSMPLAPNEADTDETKIHKASTETKIPLHTDIFVEGSSAEVRQEDEDYKTTPPKNASAEDTSSESLSDSALDGANSEDASGTVSGLLSEKFSLEDIITFAAVLLLISGNTDDELLLLAGLLLLIGQRE